MSTPLHSRSELGLRAPRSVTRLTTAVHLTAHYAGPSPWRGTIGPHSRCATIWRAWQAFHMDTRGWSDIAYSSGVCPHGHRFEGRGPGVRTAANGTNTGNRLSLATCYIAGAGDPLTTDAKHAFLDEAARFGVPLDRVHRDWKSTACPGDPLTEWVRSGAKRPGTPEPAPAPQPQPEPEPPEEDDDMPKPVVIRHHGQHGHWLHEGRVRTKLDGLGSPEADQDNIQFWTFLCEGRFLDYHDDPATSARFLRHSVDISEVSRTALRSTWLQTVVGRIAEKLGVKT